MEQESCIKSFTACCKELRSYVRSWEKGPVLVFCKFSFSHWYSLKEFIKGPICIQSIRSYGSNIDILTEMTIWLLDNSWFLSCWGGWKKDRSYWLLIMTLMEGWLVIINKGVLGERHLWILFFKYLQFIAFSPLSSSMWNYT